MARSLSARLGRVLATRGLQALVSHELGDQDQIVARADQGRAEGVAQDVARELLLEMGLDGQRDEDVASTAGGQAAARRLRKRAGLAVAPGQSGRSSSQMARFARSSGCTGSSR
jgi:hypothetical protein